MFTLTTDNFKDHFKDFGYDTNGNRRYVCRFSLLLTDEERENRDGLDFVSRQYRIAIKRANKMGGRKFHNKQYGGGLCFAIDHAEIIRVVNKFLNDDACTFYNN